jgi:hypothetical protein
MNNRQIMAVKFLILILAVTPLLGLISFDKVTPNIRAQAMPVTCVRVRNTNNTHSSDKKSGMGYFSDSDWTKYD